MAFLGPPSNGRGVKWLVYTLQSVRQVTQGPQKGSWQGSYNQSPRMEQPPGTNTPPPTGSLDLERHQEIYWVVLFFPHGTQLSTHRTAKFRPVVPQARCSGGGQPTWGALQLHYVSVVHREDSGCCGALPPSASIIVTARLQGSRQVTPGRRMFVNQEHAFSQSDQKNWINNRSPTPGLAADTSKESYTSCPASRGH